MQNHISDHLSHLLHLVFEVLPSRDACQPVVFEPGSVSMALLHVRAAAATLLRAQRQASASSCRFSFSTEATDAAAAALRMVRRAY